MNRRNHAAVVLAVLAGVVFLSALAGCARTDSQRAVDTVSDLGEYVVCSFDSEGEFVTASGQNVQPYEYKGKTYFFTSEECRKAVTSDPERYLGETGEGVVKSEKSSTEKIR